MLNKGLLEDIALLEKIDGSILKCYEKLYDAKGQILIYDEIKRLKAIEDNIIDRILMNPRIDEVLTYLSNKYHKNVAVNIGLCLEHKDLVETRIINSIFIKWTEINGDSWQKLFLPMFYVDLLKLSLSIYDQNYQGNGKYKITYNVGYLLKKIEDELISMKYEVWRHPYLSYKLLATDRQTMNMEEDAVDVECTRVISLFVEVLAKTSINAWQNEKSREEKVFISCLLRASFALMDEDYAKHIQSSMQKLINELCCDENFWLGGKLLNNVVNNTEIDREIPQILSFCR